MEDIDGAIIALLVQDPRATCKSMADATRLPESTVRSRVARLIGSGRVAPGILVHPDIESARFAYVLRIRPSFGVSARELLEQPEFSGSPWSAQSAVSGAVLLQLAAATVADMLLAIDRARRVGGVDEIAYSLVNRIYIGAQWRPDAESQTPWAPAPTRGVDATDRRLIEALRRNGRASYTELATESGLAFGPTRRRVSRLVEDGIIRFATLVEGGDASSREASVDLVVGAADVTSFIDDAVKLSAVRYVIEQSGECNIACHVVSHHAEGLAAAVSLLTGDRRVRRFTVDPFVVLRDRLTWNEE